MMELFGTTFFDFDDGAKNLRCEPSKLICKN
jgi:hypothetical protein